MRIFLLFFMFFLPQLGLAKDCSYKMDQDSIKVEWTGFKTTKKVGVTGEFEEIELNSSASGPDILSIVRDIKFSIDGLEFDAGNWVRNKNLKKSFFKKFAEKAKISGHIKEIPKTQSGELQLILVANGVRRNIPMKYNIKKDEFVATGSMEMSDFKLNDALMSISKACFKLHKGEDGISKTWSTVDLKASAKFEKVCK